MPSHEQISALARQLWQNAGQPEGRNDEFWFEAERQLASSNADSSSGKPTHAETKSDSPATSPDQLRAVAAAESIADNYLSPAPSQQAAIKAAIPPKNPDKSKPTAKGFGRADRPTSGKLG